MGVDGGAGAERLGAAVVGPGDEELAGGADGDGGLGLGAGGGGVGAEVGAEAGRGAAVEDVEHPVADAGEAPGDRTFAGGAPVLPGQDEPVAQGRDGQGRVELRLADGAVGAHRGAAADDEPVVEVADASLDRHGAEAEVDVDVLAAGALAVALPGDDEAVGAEGGDDGVLLGHGEVGHGAVGGDQAGGRVEDADTHVGVQGVGVLVLGPGDDDAAVVEDGDGVVGGAEFLAAVVAVERRDVAGDEVDRGAIGVAAEELAGVVAFLVGVRDPVAAAAFDADAVEAHSLPAGGQVAFRPVGKGSKAAIDRGHGVRVADRDVADGW